MRKCEPMLFQHMPMRVFLGGLSCTVLRFCPSCLVPGTPDRIRTCIRLLRKELPYPLDHGSLRNQSIRKGATVSIFNHDTHAAACIVAAVKVTSLSVGPIFAKSSEPVKHVKSPHVVSLYVCAPTGATHPMAAKQHCTEPPR